MSQGHSDKPRKPGPIRPRQMPTRYSIPFITHAGKGEIEPPVAVCIDVLDLAADADKVGYKIDYARFGARLDAMFKGCKRVALISKPIEEANGQLDVFADEGWHASSLPQSGPTLQRLLEIPIAPGLIFAGAAALLALQTRAKTLVLGTSNDEVARSATLFVWALRPGCAVVPISIPGASSLRLLGKNAPVISNSVGIGLDCLTATSPDAETEVWRRT